MSGPKICTSTSSKPNPTSCPLRNEPITYTLQHQNQPPVPPTVENFDYSTLRSPSEYQIKGLAKAINALLFQREDCRYHLKGNDTVSLFNHLSELKHAPNPTNIPWGDAIQSIVSMQSCMHRIGTRGTLEQHNTKKAVIAMLASLDPATQQPTNRPLLNCMTKHSVEHSRNNRAAYIAKALARRVEFEQTGDAVKLCHDVQHRPRDSLE